MSRFPLKTETITVRGMSLTVRELSTKDKREWFKVIQGDALMHVPKLCTLVCDVTLEEADSWPAEVSELVVEVARRLSGMKDADEKKD